MTKAKKRSRAATRFRSAVAKRPAPKKPARRPAAAARPAPHATKAGAKAAPVASSREKVTVKHGSTGGKGAGAAKGAAAAAKAAVKSAIDRKKAAPPPPRKVQAVQLTTLKPGARGTKASVPRLPGEAAAPVVVPAARKRRSAELTPQQLDHFRELLVQRRVRLSSDLSLMQDEALKVTAQDNSSDSVADTGTDNYEQDFTLGLIESEEALAREVDQALVRIDEDSFGVCEACQVPVPLARLEILPFARYCVECQQKREGRP